ncbi:MAG: hypothetical protein OEQ39_15875 [Gammaproteobacteria bacterium]|nr:hypothetical protein [Gammaproteobacteria bacterium]
MRPLTSFAVDRFACLLMMLVVVASCSDTKRLVFDREYLIKNGNQELAFRVSPPAYISTNRITATHDFSLQNVGVGTVECWVRIVKSYGASSQTVVVTLRDDYPPENMASAGKVINLEQGMTLGGALELNPSLEYDISFDWQ